MQIRLAIDEDLGALMALLRRVVPLMRVAGNLQWDENYPNETVLQRDIDLKQLWIAEIGPDIAGFAAVTMDQEPDYAQVGWDINEPAVVVHRLAVDPAFRGVGVASSLMHAAERIAVERDRKSTRLNSSHSRRSRMPSSA